MGTNSNPNRNQEGGNGGGPTENPSNGTATSMALKHDPGLSNEWSAEEQAILEEGLAKFSFLEPTLRYAKIAMQLQRKLSRDVALRCKWMSKKDGKRRKEDHNLTKKNKDKKERVVDPSAKSSAARPTVPPHSLPLLPMDADDEISFKDIGGLTGQLLEKNDHILKKVHVNMSSLQIQENIALLHQVRENLHKILNEANDTPAVMQQMPPLPVKLNDDLSNAIFQKP